MEKKSRLAQRVITAVAKEFEITRTELLSRARHKRVVFPRQVAMAFTREMGRWTLYETAFHFNRHHADVWQAIRRVRDIEATEPQTKVRLDKLRRMLNVHPA